MILIFRNARHNACRAFRVRTFCFAIGWAVKKGIHKGETAPNRSVANRGAIPLMPAFLSYAFAFRRKGVQVKRKRKKTNNRITFPNPLQSPKARFVISRHRVRQDLVADISVPNSPSVTASRATSPYTGEANTCGICTLHYQLDIKLNSSSVKPDFVLCS